MMRSVALNGGLYRLERLERAAGLACAVPKTTCSRGEVTELIRNAHRGAPELGLIARVEGR